MRANTICSNKQMEVETTNSEAASMTAQTFTNETNLPSFFGLSFADSACNRTLLFASRARCTIFNTPLNTTMRAATSLTSFFLRRNLKNDPGEINDRNFCQDLWRFNVVPFARDATCCNHNQMTQLECGFESTPSPTRPTAI